MNEIMRKKPLGDAQSTVLKDLARYGGTWYRGCGWQWESPALTIQILDSLVLMDLVKRLPGRDAYAFTEVGTRLGLTLLYGAPPPTTW